MTMPRYNVLDGVEDGEDPAIGAGAESVTPDR